MHLLTPNQLINKWKYKVLIDQLGVNLGIIIIHKQLILVKIGGNSSKSQLDCSFGYGAGAIWILEGGRVFFYNSRTKSLIELFLSTYLMPLVIGIHMSNESKIRVDKNFGPKNTQGYLSIYDVFLAKIFVDSDFALINFGGSNDQWY